MSAHAIRHALPLAAMLALALPGQPAAGQALSAPAAGEWVRLVTRDGARHEGRLVRAGPDTVYVTDADVVFREPADA